MVGDSIPESRATSVGIHRQAGEDFALAGLDPLRALDPTHLRLGQRSLRPDNDGPALRIETARTQVWRAI